MLYMNPPLNSFKSDTLTEQIADCLFACFFVCYFIFLFLLFSCDFVAFLEKKFQILVRKRLIVVTVYLHIDNFDSSVKVMIQ